MEELTHDAEEILETLWIEIIEKNKIPDVTIMRNNESFNKLISEGYISMEKGRFLTDKGVEEARLCVRRHRLAERLLYDVLQIKGREVHETGCKLEHILHKGLEDHICILLGHPKTCPHGSQIPEGECCRKKKHETSSFVLPLSKLKTKQNGKIAYLNTENNDILKKIMNMGILPGLSIILMQKFPAIVFKIGESQFAIDSEIADKIYV
ncbi:MAG: metal-dependent transcriptional regulator, partial [Spirochaetes bacterium]|nr:metal-dependent transcriptional regulator [Spirochaetota bacterium]